MCEPVIYKKANSEMLSANLFYSCFFACYFRFLGDICDFTEHFLILQAKVSLIGAIDGTSGINSRSNRQNYSIRKAFFELLLHGQFKMKNSVVLNHLFLYLGVDLTDT